MAPEHTQTDDASIRALLTGSLPYLLESRHIMELTGRGRDSALRIMKAGELGPCTTLAGKYVVFRDRAVHALLNRAIEPPQSSPARRPSSERARHYAKRLSSPQVGRRNK